MSPRERECPNCEVAFSGRKCPRCEWEPEAKEKKGEAGIDLCGWEGREACVFVATLWPTDAGRDAKGRNLRPGYCGWHYETLLNPRLAQEYDEFERFVLHKRARYCTQFSHHAVPYLWDTMQGLRRSKEFHARHVAQPCRQGECWVWDVLEHEKLAAMWVPPATLRATSFATLSVQLARKQWFPALKGEAESLDVIAHRVLPALP